MTSTSLFIIEEHDAVRCALEERLNRAPDLEVIGNTGKADEAIRLVEELNPDVVVIEVKRSDGLGLELIRLISIMHAAPKLAVLTSYPSFWERDAAHRSGACSYLLKNLDSEELIRHIALLAGDS